MRLDARGTINIPAMMHPDFRVAIAIQEKKEKNLLLRTWGGLGDQICAEPTLRYAVSNFKDCEITLASEHPELFSHLKFKKVYDLKKDKPNYDKYFVFDTIVPPNDSNLVWSFLSHMLTNCVDFPSICAFRLQLPTAEKDIRLSPKKKPSISLADSIVIHPGRHWPSKTFPKSFWDRVIAKILTHNICPILIGADTDDNRGTVDVNNEFCIDLRNKLTIEESAWLCMNARVVLTNDSSPLHMAAPGRAWVGYIATCKHPDYITHYRNVNAQRSFTPAKNIWQWREVNFSRGGMWETMDYCPNKGEKIEVDKVDPALLESWLPDPIVYAEWAVARYHEKKDV